MEAIKTGGPGSMSLRDASRNIGLAMELDLSHVSRWRPEGISEGHFGKRSLFRMQHRFLVGRRAIPIAHLRSLGLAATARDRKWREKRDLARRSRRLDW